MANADVPISSLPIAVSLDGSEYTDLVQAGTTKRAQVSLINSVNPANVPIGGLTGQALVKSSNVNYATMWKTVAGAGTIQEIDTGTGLTGGPITLIGTVALASIATGNVLANTSGVSAAPTPTTPSSVLDVIGSTQGDVLYRSASGWSALPPGSNGQILTSGGAAANPSWSGVGAGSVQSVGLALPNIFTVSGSPVTTTGTLTGTLATQNANLVWAGPSSGAAATPTFRSLVGSDLPNPSASTLGGVQSTTGASHQWISSISTAGVPGLSQPAFTDISGTVAASQLPNPTTSALGGVQAINAVTSNWINSINTSGVPQLSQPAFTDLTGAASLAQLPTIGNNTILANISGGSASPLATSQTALLDTIGAVQGDLLYRGASNWTVLAPGTSGQVLSSGGAAANPSWTTVSGTGTVTSVGSGTGLTGGPITSSGSLSLATIATGNVLAYTGAGSGVPVATAPSTVLDVIGSTQGSVLYRGSSNWTALTPGTNGQFLQTTGAGSTPQWAPAANISGTPTANQLAQWTNASTVQGANIASVLTAGSGVSITGTTNATVALALTNAALTTSPGAPTGTTSGSGVMMGLGGTCHLTPTYSGRILVIISGSTTSTSASATNSMNMRFGTSTAPINGASPTGTQVGNTPPYNISGIGNFTGFCVQGVVTGLSAGTAYWFDIDLATSAGTATLTGITFTAIEYGG